MVLERPGIFLGQRVARQRGIFYSLVITKQLLLSGQGHWNPELDVNFPRESLFPHVFYIYL